jgi:AcrR family transcriptional regulator
MVEVDRRQQILDAAHDLIVAEGLEGFRIREVAQRAGMHHASLLHYFPNREALVRGVVERIVARLDRVPQQGSQGDDLPAADVLRAHFRHVQAQIRTHADDFIVLNELFVRAVRDEEVRRVLAATDTSWHSFLVPLLTRGIAEGVFHAELDPMATAIVITSCFKGLGLQLALAPSAIDEAVAQLERWIIV